MDNCHPRLEFCSIVQGPGDAPVLVLIHGSVVSKESWLPQLDDLSDSYRVVALDLPGHGVLASIPFSYASSSRILADVIRRETNQPVVVAGLSLGGYVAVEFAAEYPELVRALIISGCRPHLKGGLALYLKLIGRLLKLGWLKEDHNQVEERVRKMYSPEIQDAAEIQLAAGICPDILGDVFLEMAGKDYASLLRNCSFPVYLLNGELDAGSRKGEDGFLKTCPRISLKVVPGARHALHLDQPRLYSGALRGIMQQVVSSNTVY